MKTLKNWLARHLPEPPKVVPPHEDPELQRAAYLTDKAVGESRESALAKDRIATGIARGLSRNHIAPAFDSAYGVRGHRP